MNEQMKEYLCHMTDAEKKAYNAEYYRNHKNYWQDYYSKGQTVGRPMARQKNVTEGSSGVHRRGEGLGTGPVGNSGKNGKRTTLYETILTEDIIPEHIEYEQTPEQWSQAHQNKPKPSVGDKVKGTAKQAVSDWKSGAKTISQISKDTINSGKKALSRLLSRFR